MLHIRLNFINRSKDTNDSQVLLFQKNEAAAEGGPVIAWRVIAGCKPGQSFPFKFSHELSIAASDMYGTFTEQQPAVNGQRFTLEQVPGGKALTADATGHPRKVSFVNGLHEPASVNLYRNDRLLAMATGIGSGREVSFQLADSLWIGAVSLIEEGVIIHPEILKSVHQKLILTGIASADIVMSGGGPGSHATPFVFELENVVYV
jgi:hypothetical protein